MRVGGVILRWIWGVFINWKAYLGGTTNDRHHVHEMNGTHDITVDQLLRFSRTLRSFSDVDGAFMDFFLLVCHWHR